MKFKKERIKHLLRNEILKLLAEGSIKDPRVSTFITITRMTLSQDMHYCHVYLTALGSEEKQRSIVEGLNSAKGYIQRELAQRLEIRFTPKIEFRYDEREEKADKVKDLIDQISSERQNRNDQDENDQ